MEGDGEGLSPAVDAVEFAHQQVGVEEEDDERDFDGGAAEVGEEARFFGVFLRFWGMAFRAGVELSPGVAGRLRLVAVAGRVQLRF